MSEKLYVRQVERYTVWEATEPIEIDVEKLRKCEPPYEGETEQDLLNYLEENVYANYDWAETNEEVYGEAVHELTFDEVYDAEVYSDTRDKYQDAWIEVGVPNDEYRKVGKFESRADNMQ